MEISNSGKPPNTSFSFRYNANNEELEELQACDDEPPTPQSEPPPRSESASPKKVEKSSSILDKYFKSMRTEKPAEKLDDNKPESKQNEEFKSPVPPKEVTSSPMKDYLNRLGKRTTSEVVPDVKESNETWKIFHDFKYKIAQAVEDIKTRSVEEIKEEKKALPRENSMSDSEESSAVKDFDQQSVGDTDNQVSSLDSSIQNLSEVTQPLTAKPTELDLSREQSLTKNNSESSDDTHKNIGQFDTDPNLDFLQDNELEVESGVEALEDTIDAFGDISQQNPDVPRQSSRAETTNSFIIPGTPRRYPANFGIPPNKNNSLKSEPAKNKSYFLNFSMYMLTIFLLLNYILFPNAQLWNGFLLGVWFIALVGNFKDWIVDNFFTDRDSIPGILELKSPSSYAYTIPPVKEYRPIKKIEGWLNHYRYPEYDPATYHINKSTTAFVKLEGCNLRISYTKTKIAKRALWDEKIENVTFYQHRLYNLTGARVILLPKGLVRRRQWSKKYPICIILNEKEKIQVLEKESSMSEKKNDAVEKKSKEAPLETEAAETNTSPEKKKKFVWRRKEKSITHADVEPGKEGLRHRLVRKMHRDKKTDNATTSTETESQAEKISNDETIIETEDSVVKLVANSSKDDDEDLDESELSKIKEFLDEAEMENGVDSVAEGEWSIHVKQSRDRHARLFLFTRTGRDKYDWYRRLVAAVSDAKGSADSSAADDKSTSEPAQETKDGIEMNSYKLSDKDTVAFAKNKNTESSEAVTIGAPPPPTSSFDSYEKTFFPYLLKVMEAESPECGCRSLPAEMSWLNTLVARLLFDVSRDPNIIARLQNKIQRKLHTLKLPSFMSPLTVTQLSLAGCPLVRRVRAAAADERGLWLHADLVYTGGANIAVLTQINLMKLKEKYAAMDEQTEGSDEEEEEKTASPSPIRVVTTEKQLRKRKPAIYDSDVEDSAESSSDDDSPAVQPVDSEESMQVHDAPSSTNEGTSSKKKFLRMVDKIATNKYFQQVTDYKYVKRAMEGLSNTDIKLQLELVALEGTLAINLPPPPHDRIWLGFCTNPQLVLKARPAVGARTVRFAHITNWIEQKLTREFEKFLVIPNMEDIIIDVMTPTPIEFE